MHRKPLLELISHYQPHDGANAKELEAIVSFVKSTPDCFERSHLSGHITGSAWLIDASGQRVLLTHHKKLNKWLQLGGHADGDPDALAVALREAEEESGLTGIRAVTNEIFDISVHIIPARKEVPEHYHYDIRFLLQATQGDAFVVSDESNSLAWITFEELRDYSEEGTMLQMHEKWGQWLNQRAVANSF